MNFKKQIEKYSFLRKASNLAKSCNLELYLVGGFIRDIILDRDRDEMDFLVIGNGSDFAKHLANSLEVKEISIFKNFIGKFKYCLKTYDF